MAEAQRVGPFSRLYAPWVRAIAESGASGTQVLVLVHLCQRLSFDADGNATASVPRREIAEALSLSEETVRTATRRLVKSCLLSVAKPGHNGRATVYGVFPGIPWPERHSA